MAGAGCTRNWRIGKVFDDFDATYGENPEMDWNTVALDWVPDWMGLLPYFKYIG